MTLVSVRLATVDDAEAIARVHVSSWQVAYRGHMPDHVLDGLDPVAWTTRRRRHLEDGHPGEGVFVAVDPGFVTVDPGRIVGFTIAGDMRTDDGRASGDGEVYAIYVDPPAWGTGAGRALMDAAVAYLTAAGPRPVRLWTLDGNERARRFYERYGFVADGALASHPVGDGLDVATVRYTLDPA